VLRPDGVGPIVDMGCGTGLAGLAVQELVGPMIGIELSPEMLAKAEARRIYERLIEADLLPTMREQPDASVEPILAAGGIFIATFEDALEKSDSWKLEHSGRYLHALPYLERIGRDAGFVDIVSSPIILRHEYGEPVQSLLVSFETPA